MYVLARESWGRGFATEAVQAMIGHLRSACGVTRFGDDGRGEREVHPVLQRLGFRAAMEAEWREHELSAAERLFVL